MMILVLLECNVSLHCMDPYTEIYTMHTKLKVKLSVNVYGP